MIVVFREKTWSSEFDIQSISSQLATNISTTIRATAQIFNYIFKPISLRVFVMQNSPLKDAGGDGPSSTARTLTQSKLHFLCGNKLVG